LNRMMREHVLIKYPTIGRRYNETLYGLNVKMLRVYYWKRVTSGFQVLAKRLDRTMKHIDLWKDHLDVWGNRYEEDLLLE
jgi:hypothetical protein